MLISILLMAAGLLVLGIGAELLVGGSSRLAMRLGISPLVIGLTIVAFGTSAPELAVSILSALRDHSELALGNVIGSNIANIGLILGITAFLCPIKVQIDLIKEEIPFLIAVSIALGVMLWDGRLGLIDGGLLISGLLGYLGFSYWQGQTTEMEDLALQPVVPKESNSGVYVHLVMIIAGLGLLVFGSDFFVDNAVELARLAGVNEAVIGLTLVAVGTSVPELATSVLAAIRGQTDIAVGNVIGSNLFNILSVLGLTAVISPITSSPYFINDYVVMLVFSLLLLPLAKSDLILSRREGLMLLAAYAAYITYLGITA
jgi:cation:H+ antiporter